MHAVAKALTDIEGELNKYFLERRDAIRAMLLALVSGEHVFLLSPPGAAKSQMVRVLVECITGMRYFEAQLSKTTPIEAIRGPLDVLEFRQTGAFHYKRAGYATQVEAAFLDEIGKAGPTLWNDLLALSNERVYHEVNGTRSVHKAPLSTLFAASNEMITDEHDSAAALWDRLLFRVLIDYIKDKRNFGKLLTAAEPNITTTVPWDELHACITVEVPAIEIPEDVIHSVILLRSEFKKNSIKISDRRWRASMKALRASAFLNGRSEVNADDLAVLQYTLWDTVEQIEKVRDLCLSASNPFVRPLGEIRTRLREIESGVKERETGDAGGKWQYGKEATQKLDKVRDELDVMLIEAMGQPIPGFKAVSDQHERILVNTLMVCLEQPADAAAAMAGKKLGSGDGGNV